MLLFLPLSAQRTIITVRAGEALSNESWVYIKVADGKAWKADLAAAASQAVGFVAVGGAVNDYVQVFVSGEVDVTTGLTVGSYYFLSAATTGAYTITQGAGDYQQLFKAIQADRILIDIKATVSASGGGGMAIGGSITSATAGSVLFSGASGVLRQDNANLFWDDTNNRLGIGTASPAYLLDIKKVGHNPTFSGPGDLVYRMVDNDMSGGRPSNLNLYHQYFPSQAIDIYSFLNTNGFTGGVDFSLGFGSLYGSNNLFIKGGGILFDNCTSYFTQASATRLTLLLNGTTGAFNITQPGGDLTNLQFTPTAGLRVQGNYESRTLLQTSQALGGTVILPLSASDKPLIVKGFSGQTADLQQWQNSAGTVLSVVNSAGNVGIGTASPTKSLTIGDSGSFGVDATNTATATTGAQTINKSAGTVNFAAGATTLTVTNSLVSTASLVFPVIRTNDATATIKNVVAGAGSFTITLNAAATAETSVGFFLIN